MSLIYSTQGHRLYVGGKKDAKNLQRLREWQITHILNVTPAKEVSVTAGVPNYFEKQFVYLRIPVYDASTSVLEFQKSAEKIIKFIAVGLVHGNVLVHCQMGASRSVTAAILYLIQRVGMTLESALDIIQRRRPSAQPIPEFLELLRDFEIRCTPSSTFKSPSSATTTSSTKSAARSTTTTENDGQSDISRMTGKKRAIGPSPPRAKRDNPPDASSEAYDSNPTNGSILMLDQSGSSRTDVVIGPTLPGNVPPIHKDIFPQSESDPAALSSPEPQRKRPKIPTQPNPDHNYYDITYNNNDDERTNQ